MKYGQTLEIKNVIIPINGEYLIKMKISYQNELIIIIQTLRLCLDGRI